MREGNGDIFDVDCDVLAITTNGFVKKNGECVMGRGCAAKAKKLYPDIDKRLGYKIKKNGNVVNLMIGYKTKLIVSFPVKPITKKITDINQVVRHQQKRFKVGETVPGWAVRADIDIIKTSAKNLVELADKFKWETIVLPQAGCGYGELSWEVDVKPILSEILDDRFIAMTF